MTPKQLAEEAADKSWGKAESGKGMMQDAVEAALSTFAKAQAKEFRRLARERDQCAKEAKASDTASLYFGWAEGYYRAAQMLEEKLNADLG